MVEDRGEHAWRELACVPGTGPGRRGARTAPGTGAGHMSWCSPVPLFADDDTGTTWQVQRAWPFVTPGDYILEVRTPGRPGVRGAHLRHGHFELIPLDDPRLPALRSESQHGVLVRYMPHKRAVIRAQGSYIKVFRPGLAIVPAERCAQLDVLLDAGHFTTPRILRRSSQDVIVFSAIPGRTLNELGGDGSEAGDDLFDRAWAKWAHAWVAQLTTAYVPAEQRVLSSLPLHSPEVEAARVRRRMDHWLSCADEVRELSRERGILLARAGQVTEELLRAAPDPLVWAHGDLHDKQIIATDGPSAPGLLDFDGTSRAEAALDLADLDVHLELQLRQNRLTPARYRTAHGHVLAAAEELGVSPDRFHVYSDVFWLRLAVSPLPGRLSLAIAVLAERATPQEAVAGEIGFRTAP
ncbi:phosphotransferase [Arthrobacter sp. UYCu712]|uniref:phosphotransferase n=1 Tax=Arthrobacter sp. UYCu712 TaxID=3156340 RepID=UPI0033955A67